MPSGIRHNLTTLIFKPDIDLERVKSTVCRFPSLQLPPFFQIKIAGIAAFVRNMPKWPVLPGEIGADYA